MQLATVRIGASYPAAKHVWIVCASTTLTPSVRRNVDLPDMFAPVSGDVVIAATHDAELLALLPDFAPYHLVDGLGPAGPEFHYRLTPGPATTRNAIALLELYGAPADVVARSRVLTESLETGGRLRPDAASPHPLP